jgi:hypothetical protein
MPANAGQICPAKSCSTVPTQSDGQGNTLVTNVCELQGIPAGSTAHYALNQDINASCTATWNNGAGFTPIPGAFAGAFEGNGHRVDRLFISSASTEVGLFQSVGSAGTVDNLAITNANIAGSSSGQSVGVLAGDNSGAISFAYVTGAVAGGSTLLQLGGIAGRNFSGGRISLSYSGATVSGGAGGNNNDRYAFGGLVGSNHGTVTSSYASGSVNGDVGSGGGLVGYNNGTITQSFATGSIASGSAGGLVGWNQGGKIDHSWASTSVGGGTGLAGLVQLDDLAGSIDQSYSVGVVSTGQGLVASIGYGGGNVTNSYWDTQTSGPTTSAAGTGLATTAFKAGLPGGFDSGIWSSVASVSYPFLTDFSCPYAGSPQPAYCTVSHGVVTKTESCIHRSIAASAPQYPCMLTELLASFQPPLAQFSVPSGVYTAIPIGQLQTFQYYNASNANMIDGGHSIASEACFGTVYTMLARLVGAIHPDATIQNTNATPNMCGVASELASSAHIDCLLEKSTDPAVNGTGFWPLSQYASLAANVAPLKNALNDAAAENLIKSGHPLIIVGTTTNQLTHAMLATSLIEDGTGKVIRIVVNDPELGQQIFIDMVASDRAAYHRPVLNPTGPGNYKQYSYLTGFGIVVNGYRTVTLN